ncbi:MAG TPA: hypothetical protein PKD99_17820, partial [Sphingopyxis sp.]|nr:hypothetical protein [Sphingopyxis sp.]HMP46959.1 hypothetical protein [Sphingopyxis sp.]
MRRAFAALAAALLCVSAAPPPDGGAPDQAVIDGEAMPRKLSEFGLFRAGTSEPVEELIPYTLHTPLFSDYADKHRRIWLPRGEMASIHGDGHIEFPVGTVIVKSFGWPDWNGGRPVETRLLIHRAKGWVALPYIWDADGRDATLAVGGRRVPVSFAAPDGSRHDIAHAVPNMNQCKECHNRGGRIVPIGPKAENIDFGGEGAKHPSFLLPKNRLRPMPRWDDPASGSIAARARAYIDVNCAHCHNPEGSASNSGLFLRWTDDPAGVNYGIGKRPTAAGRGSGGMDFAIAPGDPAHSFLIYRLEST